MITPQQLQEMAGTTFMNDVLILNQIHYSTSKPISRSELRWYKKPTGQLVIRDTLVEKIGKTFSSLSASKKNPIIVLSGEAGVGKTALAQYYFSCPSLPYHFMAWFDALSEHVLIQQYADLARQAGFLQGIEQQEKKKLITAVKKGLKDITRFCQMKLSLIPPHKESFSLGSVIFYQNQFFDWYYCFKTIDGLIQNNKLKNVDDDVIAYLTQASDILHKLNKQTLQPYWLEDLIPISMELRPRLIGCTTYSDYFYPRCLLVFDGVPEHTIVEEFLLRENADIIITSQENYWPGYEAFNVPAMEYSEACALVKNKLDSEDEEIDVSEVEKLVSEVGCLPSELTAITQEIVNNGMGIKQYLESRSELITRNLS